VSRRRGLSFAHGGVYAKRNEFDVLETPPLTRFAALLLSQSITLASAIHL